MRRKKKIFLPIIILVILLIIFLVFFFQKKLTGDVPDSTNQPNATEKNGIDLSKQEESQSTESRQSDLMWQYTGEKWSPELEKALEEVDFEAYGFDVENPTLIEDVNDLFVLANKANYFPKDFEPINLVLPQTNHAGGPDRRSMRKIAADALDQLTAAAQEDGWEIKSISAYRTIAYQEVLFNSYAATDGEEAANRYSSKPGYSEHHTGLCVDVSSPSMGFGLDQSYGDTSEGKWLEDHAHQYGFVIRYPKGKEHLTGYTYEPWHLRYLGVPLATYLKENDLCYEEFLGLQVGKSPEEIEIHY